MERAFVCTYVVHKPPALRPWARTPWYPAVGPLPNKPTLHPNTPLNPISHDIGLLDDASLACGALLSNHAHLNSVELLKTTAAKYLQLLLPNRRPQ